jgi:CheY-like chemotaxis protein
MPKSNWCDVSERAFGRIGGDLMNSTAIRRKAYETRARMISMRAPRILLAEDDPDVRHIVASTLRANGYSVIEAKDGNELLEQLGGALMFGHIKGWADPIYAVVSDVRMPGWTGLEILEGLRSAEVGMPVVLMTANSDAKTRAEAKRLGADAMLLKPLDLDVLCKVLHDLDPAAAQEKGRVN